MQKLLSGEVRFDGFSDKWKEVRIDKLFDFKKGQELSKEKLEKNGIFECILYGELYTTYSEVISEIKSKTNIKEGIKSKIDDILIPASTTTSAIDLAIASTIQKDNVLIGGDINILRKKTNNINGEFISKYLTHIKKMEIAKYAQGITIIHLYSKDFKHLKIQLPSLPEQQKIAEVLSLADDEINLLKNELEELKLQKKALMQKLLTGQVRVKV
jgi:type I restriction enzyme S subunit